MISVKRSIKFALIVLLLSTVCVYGADVVLSGNILGHILVPNDIDYGYMYMGYAVDEQTLFKVNSTSTGATVNVTLINSSALIGQYQIRAPDSTTTIIMPNETIQFVLSDAGDYTLKILPNKVGIIDGVIRVLYNDEEVNCTRY